jgi:nickel-dependent lactate racemase
MDSSANGRTVPIAYGKGSLELQLDPALAEFQVIRPAHKPPAPDPQALFHHNCRHPIASPALRELISPGDRVVIVTSDGTRPVPNQQLIPWLLEALPVPPDQVTVLIGTGTHRGNTPAEIEEMFGPDLTRTLRIVNHDAYDSATNREVGTTSSGLRAKLNSAYLDADKRIAIGFIEPHFFAGFSGGCKAVAPGVANLGTILQLHSYKLIGDPNSVWGELEHNPIQREIAEIVAFRPPEFLVNVTLNSEKQITGIFAGHYREAHRAGCARAKATSMVPVPARFPVVITSNSGFPLDQNLYQTVKGMSAAARIVEPGGEIVVVSECRDGFPDHGDFRSFLEAAESPEALDRAIRDLPKPQLDQWQVQILARIQRHARVSVYSTMNPGELRSAGFQPIANLQEYVNETLRKRGNGCRVAVLPDGPLTIPYLASA